jgi:survival-of-motor-neuron-related-splicing factor 30
MQQLEGAITEYRNKLAQIERILKEEDDIKDDPDKKEEVEKLRDQLKEHMIIQLNELKFIQNQQVTLSKNQHSGRVCEAYFDEEKTWYAALVLEVYEELQEVEIAWIGYKKQTRTLKKHVNILSPPDPTDLFEGAQCNAVFTTDGMWYPCTVEKVINDEN